MFISPFAKQCILRLKIFYWRKYVFCQHGLVLYWQVISRHQLLIKLINASIITSTGIDVNASKGETLLGGGALPLWESVGMCRGFASHFRQLDDLFAPQNLTMSTILFRSCWVPFWTSSSTPLLIFTRSATPPNRQQPFDHQGLFWSRKRSFLCVFLKWFFFGGCQHFLVGPHSLANQHGSIRTEPSGHILIKQETGQNWGRKTVGN